MFVLRLPFSYTLILYVALIGVVLFEGALTKWAGLPSFLLMFARDGMAGLIILIFVRQRKYFVFPVICKVAAAWSVAVVTWAFITGFINDVNPILIIIGLRFWLLYLWFAIAVASLLTKDEIMLTIRVLMFGGLINLVLASFQVSLPSDHILNYTANSEDSYTFTLAGGIVRVTGTFSFTLGYTCFAALLAPFLLSGKYLGKPLLNFPLYSFVLLACIFVMTGFSGSRASLMWAVMLFMVFIFLNFAQGGNKNTKITLILFLVLAVVASITLFQDMINAYIQRFENAASSEDIGERNFVIILGEGYVYEKFNFWGYGVGLGNNAASIFNKGARSFLLAETETGRNVMEAGAFGLMYLMLKFCLTAWAGLWSWIYFQKTKDTFPVLLTLTCGYSFITWPVSGQISANAFAYIGFIYFLFYIKETKFVLRIT